MIAPSARRSVVAAAALALTGTAAFGQQLVDNSKQAALSTGVPAVECAFFQRNVLDMAKLHIARGPAQSLDDTYSREWLGSVLRFVRAGCQTEDAQGPVQLITMTKRDEIGLEAARMLQAPFDVMRASGVDYCHRPDDGKTCPRRTGALAHPKAGGG